MKINYVNITRDDEGIRLDRWFQRHCQDMPFTIVAKMLRTGQIKLNNKRAKISTILQEHDELRFPYIDKYKKTDEDKKTGPRTVPDNILKSMANTLKDNIIAITDDVIVINKPQGLACQSGTKTNVGIDTLIKHIKIDGQVLEGYIVHRLDKNTSGVMIVARSRNIAAKIAKEFKNSNVHKEYLALVAGVPDNTQGVIKAKLIKNEGKGLELVRVDETSGKYAATNYEVIDKIEEKIALMRFMPITGRTHQIRVHTKHIGHPIIGDDQYGHRLKELSIINQHKLHLHAHKIKFELNGKQMEFSAPLPSFFIKSLETFELKLY